MWENHLNDSIFMDEWTTCEVYGHMFKNGICVDWGCGDPDYVDEMVSIRQDEEPVC